MHFSDVLLSLIVIHVFLPFVCHKLYFTTKVLQDVGWWHPAIE